MSTVKAIINGVKVELPVDLFNDIALIPKSEYSESYWTNNHMESPCLDMETDNGWSWTINRSDVGAQVLQICPDYSVKIVDVAIPGKLYDRLKALLEKSSGRKQS